MPWDPVPASAPNFIEVTTDIDNVTERFAPLPSDGAGTDFTAPLFHEPGEISDLHLLFWSLATTPSVPIRVSVYSTMEASPTVRGDYSTEPLQRIQYVAPVAFGDAAGPPTDLQTDGARLAIPVGRLFKLIFGFIMTGGTEDYQVGIEWRQDGVNLAP